MLGTSVGTYRITGAIGRGGMGAVYLAEHALLGRLAAVKVLLPEYSRDQEMVTRFFNEARAATAIRHPGIVEIYDFGWHGDGTAYIVMEHLQGESLSARLARGRPAARHGVTLVRQIAGALAAAHRKGIVHRDLKPDNVFLVPDPEVPGGERIKLLDFGIAKLADAQRPEHRTRTGAVVGTPTYMAPEQCRGVAVDHRADLYALGCILFEVMCGRPPFVGEGVGDVLAAHIHVAPPRVEGAPEAVDHLVQRLLVKEPAQRVQQADEVIHAIDVMSGSLGSGGAWTAGTSQSGIAAMPTTLSSMARATHAAPSPRLGRWAAIAGAVLMLAGAGAMFAGRGGGDVPAVDPALDGPVDGGIDGPVDAPPARPPIDAAPPAIDAAPPAIDAAPKQTPARTRKRVEPRAPRNRDVVDNPF